MTKLEYNFKNNIILKRSRRRGVPAHATHPLQHHLRPSALAYRAQVIVVGAYYRGSHRAFNIKKIPLK